MDVKEVDTKEPLLEGAPRQWSIDLYDVSTYPWNTLLSFCFPCLRFAQTASRAKLKPEIGQVGWFLAYLFGCALFFSPFIWPWCSAGSPIVFTGSAYGEEIMLPWCGTWYLALPTIVMVGAHHRHQIRAKYNIASRAGAVEDCCVHACCEPCALAQEGAEVDLRERGEVVTSVFMDEQDREYDRSYNPIGRRHA